VSLSRRTPSNEQSPGGEERIAERETTGQLAAASLLPPTYCR